MDQEQLLKIEVALSRALSTFVRKHGEFHEGVGDKPGRGHCTMDIPVGDDDEYYPYTFVVKDDVLSMSVMEEKMP